MNPLTPFDVLIALALAVRRFGLARTLIVSFLLSPLALYALPPVSCGCMPVLFRRCTYGRAYVAAAKSDLANLASQQEIHFAEHGSYSLDPDALAFSSSDGVRNDAVPSSPR